LPSSIALIKKGAVRTMMFKVFIISVGIAFSIQIIHSVLTKGGRFTLEFFGGGFLFGFVREFIYASFIQSYEFPNMPIKLLNVPIFIPIGWVFTFYLAYEFTNKLIRTKTVKDYKDFIIFAAFFSTCICIPIETAALNMNWWSLYFSANSNIAPMLLMSGWFYTSVVFFCIYFVAKKKLPREQLWFAVFLLIAVFVGEFKLVAYVGLVGWALEIIGLGGMFKYNKEITLILLVYCIIVISYIFFISIPNGIFVTIAFIFNFIFILVKLHSRDVIEQLRMKEFC
jgi:hypothetical protein